MSGEAFLTSLGLATPEASLTQQNASAHAEAFHFACMVVKDGASWKPIVSSTD